MFWVQVHDIPIHFMCTEVAEKICENIGEVVRSIGAETEEGGNFTRVRVTSPYLCAEEDWLLLKARRNLKCRLSLSAYQISASSVLGWFMVIVIEAISHGVRLEKFNEIPCAYPNELFRRRIEEINYELKKIDDHVTGSVRAISNKSTIPRFKDLKELEQMQKTGEAASLSKAS